MKVVQARRGVEKNVELKCETGILDFLVYPCGTCQDLMRLVHNLLPLDRIDITNPDAPHSTANCKEKNADCAFRFAFEGISTTLVSSR